jgi:hypothetical protein
MFESSEPADDAEMLDLVKSVLTGPAAVPPEVVTAARAAFELRSLDVELAALIYDSETDNRLLAGLRAPESSARTLVFRAEESTVEVEFREGLILGQIDPPSRGRVSLESPRSRLGEAAIDSAGCFVIEGSFTGMIRITLHGPDDTQLMTEWTRL